MLQPNKNSIFSCSHCCCSILVLISYSFESSKSFLLRFPSPGKKISSCKISDPPHTHTHSPLTAIWKTLYTGQIQLPDCVYFPSYSVKCFVFHALALGDVMTFEKLKFDYLKSFQRHHRQYCSL